MEPFMEFEGKNIDQATENACAKLNKPKNALKFDIISNGSSGIFGIVGVKKARIRVYLDDSEKASLESIDHKPDLEKQSDEEMPNIDEAFGDDETQHLAENELVSEREMDDDIELEDIEDQTIVITDKVIETGREALEKIINRITENATVSVKKEKDRIIYNVSGGNSAVLIGKRGQHLEAIQYIIDKIVNKQSEKRVRLQIDVEGYLDTKRVNLKKLASKLAEKAKRTGKPSTIGQMNAHDRRIVHLELKGDKGVRTQSIGEGYYRKLIIFPKKINSKKKKQ